MPRRARLSLPGIPWHIIQRGNNRSVCFYAEEDYRLYLHHLQELAPRFGCAVHAYVLMTNHVHLLLTPDETDSAGLLMKHLGQRYVQYVNRAYRRSGTLWEGRFRSCLTQTEEYVLTCYRYIELNPVRAGIVRAPQGYRWSSHHANAFGATDAVVVPHDEYLALGSDALTRQAAYQLLFAVDLPEHELAAVRVATNKGWALGAKRFRDDVASLLERRTMWLGRRSQGSSADP